MHLIRFGLNYKKLPYTTTWLEFPEIEPTATQIGAPPTGRKPDGSPFYTTPIIHDPNTNKTLSNSIDIARYLDDTYPDTLVLPDGEASAQRAKHIEGVFFIDVAPYVLGIGFLPALQRLNPASQPYFRATREAVTGASLEDLASPGPERDEKWRKAEEGFGKLAAAMEKAGLGEEGEHTRRLEYAELVIGAYLVALQRTFGEESDEWRAIESWQGGRWKRLVDKLRPYMQDT